MNFRQCRYIVEIAKNNLNISRVAEALHTSQPGISKQVRMLEIELGLDIFVRAGNRLSGITADGERIVAYARRAMEEIQNIEAVAQEVRQPNVGTLILATTHTQARYVLPEVMKVFADCHPKVKIIIRHGSPEQITNMVGSGEADIGVTTDAPPDKGSVIVVPWRQFDRVVIVPRKHKLLQHTRISLKNIAQYPLITYEPQFTGRRELIRAFEKEGLNPTLSVSAIDADVIKTCVEQSLGIAVLSEVTFNPKKDSGLRSISAKHLFPPSVTSLLINRKRHLQKYVYDFIQMCSPSWSKSRLQSPATNSVELA